MTPQERILNIVRSVCSECQVDYAGDRVLIWSDGLLYMRLGAAKSDYYEICKAIKEEGFSIEYEDGHVPEEDDYSWMIEVCV